MGKPPPPAWISTLSSTLYTTLFVMNSAASPLGEVQSLLQSSRTSNTRNPLFPLHSLSQGLNYSLPATSLSLSILSPACESNGPVLVNGHHLATPLVESNRHRTRPEPGPADLPDKRLADLSSSNVFGG